MCFVSGSLCILALVYTSRVCLGGLLQQAMEQRQQRSDQQISQLSNHISAQNTTIQSTTSRLNSAMELVAGLQQQVYLYTFLLFNIPIFQGTVHIGPHSNLYFNLHFNLNLYTQC